MAREEAAVLRAQARNGLFKNWRSYGDSGVSPFGQHRDWITILDADKPYSASLKDKAMGYRLTREEYWDYMDRFYPVSYNGVKIKRRDLYGYWPDCSSDCS